MSLRIGFIRVRYQEAPEVVENVSPKVAEYSSIFAFPSSPTFERVMSPDYRGIKIVRVDDSILVSLFGYMGERDKFRRPVLTARIIVFDEEAFDIYGRSPSRIVDYINKMNRFDANDFTSFIKKTAPMFNRSSFKETVSGFSIRFISSLACSIFRYKSGIVLYDNWINALKVLDLIYLTSPIMALRDISVSTDCGDLKSDDREDIVFVYSKDKKAKKDAKNISRRKKIPLIRENEVSMKCDMTNAFEVIIKEMIDDFDWFGMSWNEKYRILIDFMNKRLSGERISLADMNDSLRKILETAKRIEGVEDVWRRI